MNKSPLAVVKERFGDKQKLIDEVRALATDDLWIGRLNEDGGLDLVSNAKLLHLHEVLSAVKAQHGSRSALIDAILAAEKRSKDAGYRDKLETWPTPRLWDRYRARA